MNSLRIRRKSTATITVDHGSLQRINVQERGIIRSQREDVISLHDRLDSSIHVGSVVINETLIQTRPRVSRTLRVGIREGELHLFLAELSRILVVVIEGRGSALRGSRPVAADESGSHLRVLSHNELERRRRRSHRVSSRHRVHLIARSISKRTSDCTRGRIHVHSLGKSGTDGELTEIGVRTSRHRSTYWSSNRIHSSDTWEFQ